MGYWTSVGVNQMPRVATRNRPLVGPEQGPRRAALPPEFNRMLDRVPQKGSKVPRVPRLPPLELPAFPGLVRRTPLGQVLRLIDLLDKIPQPGVPVRNPRDLRFKFPNATVLQHAECPNFYGNSGTDYTGANGIYAMVWNGGTPANVICLEAQSWGFPLEVVRPDGTLTGNIYNFSGPGFRMVTFGPRNNAGTRFKNSIADLYQVPGNTSAETVPGWTVIPSKFWPDPNRERGLPAEPRPDQMGFGTPLAPPGELAPGSEPPGTRPGRTLPKPMDAIKGRPKPDKQQPPQFEPLPRTPAPGVIPTVPWVPIRNDTPIASPFPTVVITPAPASPEPGTKTGDIIKAPGRPHTRTPPRRREKEAPKALSRSGRQIRAIFAALDALSEWSELVDALYDALPDDVKKRWGKDRDSRGLLDNAGQYGIDGADWKIQALWANWHRLDTAKAFRNIVKNEVQDKLLGLLNRNLPRNVGRAVDPGMKEFNAWLESTMATLGF